MKNKTRILLTGASGCVGREVLNQLSQKSNEFDITVFDIKSKPSTKILLPYKGKVEIVYGDIANKNDISKVCSDKDYVIHLAAIIPPLADDKPELAYQVNTVGTENFINNLEQLSPKTFFMYSSSVSVYGDRLKSPMIKVKDPLKPSEGDEYAKTKIEAEQLLQKSKLDWTIFRLCAIMGDHKISKLMFHQPLKTPLEIATPEDTARAFVNAIYKKEQLSKKIFNLGGGENCRISYMDFLIRSFQIFGLGKLNFPPKAFAEKNFHCGYYKDGDDLNNILHFRKDNLDSYFKKVKLETPRWQKVLASLFKVQIKRNILNKSEPYQAFKTNDHIMIQHFFNNKNL